MLQKSIILRHQSSGYIRFDMPADFRQSEIAQALEQGIQKFRGIYRVGFSVRTTKLTIRYDDTATGFSDIARALHKLVSKLTPQMQSNTPLIGLRHPVDDVPRITQIINPLTVWMNDKIQEVKETITAMGVLLKNRLGNDSTIINNPEKVVIEFFNDVIVLYLIKLHWHLITQHWLRKPIQYRYEWMAVLYLLYLLVRAKQAAFRSNHESQN